MEINTLVEQAKNGNIASFEELYDIFAQRVFSFIKTKVQNRQDAEDILQDVFIKTHRGLDTLRPGELNFSGWLFKIARNTINDYFRKKYRQPEICGMDEDFDISDNKCLYEEIMFKSDLESAQEKFKYLSVQHRNVLELRIFQELSLNEVASALNKSALAVKMLQHRARKKLLALMEN